MTATAQFDKAVMTACAEAALAGIVALPSRDERGRRTIILSQGAWTRVVLVPDLHEALAELRALEFAN